MKMRWRTDADYLIACPLLPIKFRMENFMMTTDNANIRWYKSLLTRKEREYDAVDRHKKKKEEDSKL